MAENTGPKKGNRKLGRNKTKCATYRLKHGGGSAKKIVGSREHRGRGPLALYLRRKAILDKKYGVYKHTSGREDSADTSNARVRIK